MGQIPLTLIAKQQDQDPRQIVERVFGGDPEMLEYVQRLIDHEPQVLQWLNENAATFVRFTKDPAGEFGRKFPHLRFPGRQPAQFAQIDRFTPKLPDPIRPAGYELLQKLWDYLLQDPAHVDAFRANPFAVLNTVGAQEPPQTLDAAKRALEIVFGMRRLNLKDKVQQIVEVVRQARQPVP